MTHTLNEQFWEIPANTYSNQTEWNTAVMAKMAEILGYEIDTDGWLPVSDSGAMKIQLGVYSDSNNYLTISAKNSLGTATRSSNNSYLTYYSKYSQLRWHISKNEKVKYFSFYNSNSVSETYLIAEDSEGKTAVFMAVYSSSSSSSTGALYEDSATLFSLPVNVTSTNSDYRYVLGKKVNPRSGAEFLELYDVLAAKSEQYENFLVYADKTVYRLVGRSTAVPAPCWAFPVSD